MCARAMIVRSIRGFPAKQYSTERPPDFTTQLSVRASSGPTTSNRSAAGRTSTRATWPAASRSCFPRFLVDAKAAVAGRTARVGQDAPEHEDPGAGGFRW